MGLFKRKKKVEEIQIKPVDVTEVVDEVIIPNIPTYHLPASSEEAITVIYKEYKRLTNTYDDLIKQFYICKFFALAVLKTDDDFSGLASLEKQICKIKETYESVRLKVKKISEEKDYSEETLESLYQETITLKDDCVGLLSKVNDTRNHKYNTLKMSSVAVIINKSGEALEKLDKRFTTFVNSFKSLEEASDYIYVNSGEFVVALVNSLLRCVNSSNNPNFIKEFNFHYFISSDVVLCLDLAEWVELNSKIMHCTNVLRNVDISTYVNFQTYLADFEIRYLILMIHEEKKRLNKGENK